MADSQIALIEPAVILDTFVSGVGRVEELSPNLYRVSYYAKHKSAYDGSEENVLVAKFIVTFETMLAMAGATVEKRIISNDALGITPSGTLN